MGGKINNLKAAGIDPQLIENASSSIKIQTKIISEDGNATNSHSETSMGIGFIAGILIYMLICIYNLS